MNSEALSGIFLQHLQARRAWTAPLKYSAYNDEFIDGLDLSLIELPLANFILHTITDECRMIKLYHRVSFFTKATEVRHAMFELFRLSNA